MIKNVFEGIQRNINIIIIVLTVIIYFLVQVYTLPEFNVVTVLKKPSNITLVVLTSITNFSIATNARDLGNIIGMGTLEFKVIAEVYEQNLRVIKPKKSEFKQMIREDNLNNFKQAQADVLFDYQVTDPKDLPTRRAKRLYKKPVYKKLVVDDTIFLNLLENNYKGHVKKLKGIISVETIFSKTLGFFKTLLLGLLWASLGITSILEGGHFNLQGLMGFSILSIGLIINFLVNFTKSLLLFQEKIPKNAYNNITYFTWFNGSQKIVSDQEYENIIRRMMFSINKEGKHEVKN